MISATALTVNFPLVAPGRPSRLDRCASPGRNACGLPSGVVTPHPSTRKTGVNRAPEQQHGSDHATQRQTLEAVGCQAWLGLVVPGAADKAAYLRRWKSSCRQLPIRTASISDAQEGNDLCSARTYTPRLPRVLTRRWERPGWQQTSRPEHERMTAAPKSPPL